MDVNEKTTRNTFCMKIVSILTVDVQMLPSKICYIFFGGLLGSHVPFLTVFFVSVGLTAGQAGFINGIRFASSSVSGPLWGMLADYSGRRKLVLVLMCLGAAFPLFSMPWVSNLINPIMQRNSSCIFHLNTSSVKNRIIFNHAASSSTDQCLDSKEKMAANNFLFYVLLSIMLFGSVFVGPLPGYIDSIVMNVVKTAKRESSYGIQRIFGSLGFSIASFVAGVASDNYKEPNMSPYTAVFCLYLPYTLLLIPFGCYLVGQTNWDVACDDAIMVEKDAKKKQSNKSMASQISILFRRFDVVFFMSTVMISGVACNLVQNFAILLVSEVMTATETEMSLIFVIATASEVALFLFTSRIIKFLGGTAPAMILGTFSYFVRFLVMSYTTRLWIMLLVQTLHAFGFALNWAAMMEYLHDVTPNEILLTMFLVFQSVHFGVAALVANIAGGYLYQMYGGRLLFRGNAVICGVWALLMVAYYGSKFVKEKFGRKTYDYLIGEKDLLTCNVKVVRYDGDTIQKEIIGASI